MHEAYIKFEQGHRQKPFLDQLFDVFRVYCFMEGPGRRLFLSGERVGEVKSLPQALYGPVGDFLCIER